MHEALTEPPKVGLEPIHGSLDSNLERVLLDRFLALFKMVAPPETEILYARKKEVDHCFLSGEKNPTCIPNSWHHIH